jgi:hypothetical protein
MGSATRRGFRAAKKVADSSARKVELTLVIKQSAFSFSVRFPQHDRRRLLAAKTQDTVRLRYA